MSRSIVLALAASIVAFPAFAADHKFDPETAAKAIALYLDEQTIAVLHVDLAAVDVGALVDKIAALAKVDADALPLPRKEASAAVKAILKSGVQDLYIVVSLADVPERPPFAV